MKALRSASKKTQKEIAILLGVPRSNIGKYERGNLSVPTDILIKYAEIFDVSIDYICGVTDIPTSWNKLNDLYKKYDKDISLEQFIVIVSQLSERRKMRLLANLSDMVIAEKIEHKNSQKATQKIK